MRFATALALSLVIATLGAQRQGRATEAGVDPLDRLLDAMAASAGFEAHFDEALEIALLREPVRSQGSLYFVPPKRMARFTRTPAATTLLVDGERIEYRDAEGERVDLSGTAMAQYFTNNLVLLFSGDRAALEKAYAVSFEESPESWRLTLIPRRAPLKRALARIVLSGRGERLDAMDVHDAEGTRTITRFERVRVDRHFDSDELSTLFEKGQPLPDPPKRP